MRLLVVGADAAGMSAAHQALRRARQTGLDLEVVACEMSEHTSYSQCGVPYWVAGDVAGQDDLVARSAADHRRLGVDLRLRHQVMALDLAAGSAEVRDHEGERTVQLGFDQVLLATGSAPVIPDWALRRGELRPGIHPMQNLTDGAWWRRVLAERPARALVVGGGYIGVEAAESLARRGVQTTLLTRRAPMAATLVAAQQEQVSAGLRALGVDVIGGAEIAGLSVELDRPGYTLHAADGRSFRGDVVVLAIGVQPRTELAAEAGLRTADPERHPWARRALVPDDRQQLADGVWAAGDCCAVFDRVVRQPSYLPLGTHANKAGRVAGTNIGGGSIRFPGAVGTAITRAGEVEVARAGIQPDWAEELGYDLIEASLEATTASGYMPEAHPMRLWAAADRASGELIGCQITGGQGAGKRIDIAATAMMAGLTCEQIAYLDLAYAPPFSPTWDPVQIVVRKLADRLSP